MIALSASPALVFSQNSAIVRGVWGRTPFGFLRWRISDTVPSFEQARVNYDARLMRCYSVSTRINNVANDDEECSRRWNSPRFRVGSPCNGTVGLHNQSISRSILLGGLAPRQGIIRESLMLVGHPPDSSVYLPVGHPTARTTSVPTDDYSAMLARVCARRLLWQRHQSECLWLMITNPFGDSSVRP